ncbi:hypothetical protein FBUS_11666 [Fasciolopsis buskii]|uniref:Uncharacterized protein n=1 Tax=Fasciolopsis buskii TaxID=27845 RepID=A0A8E0RLR5_9TREM|nr:hypothetical protein FBUS_11666 [Fasciolopsis buski]
MELVKQRLAAIRSEENELREKASKIEENIKTARIDNDKVIQIELQSLHSTEKLLKLKIELATERLNKVLSMLSSQEESASSYEKELKNLNAAQKDLGDKEADLEMQLSNARESSREIQSKYDEALIHLQHIEEAKRKKLAQAELIEKQVEALEKEHSMLKQAWNKAENTDTHVCCLSSQSQFYYRKFGFRQFLRDLVDLKSCIMFADHSFYRKRDGCFY